MSTIHYLKKMTVGALLSGGVALAALGMTAGTADAAPQNPNPPPATDKRGTYGSTRHRITGGGPNHLSSDPARPVRCYSARSDWRFRFSVPASSSTRSACVRLASASVRLD